MYVDETAFERHGSLFSNVMCNQLCTKGGKTSLYMHNVFAMAPKVYNKLPLQIRKYEDIHYIRDQSI